MVSVSTEQVCVITNAVAVFCDMDYQLHRSKIEVAVRVDPSDRVIQNVFIQKEAVLHGSAFLLESFKVIRKFTQTVVEEAREPTFHTPKIVN